MHAARSRPILMLMTTFLLSTAILVTSSRAARLTEDQVRRAAQTYARMVTRDARTDAVVVE